MVEDPRKVTLHVRKSGPNGGRSLNSAADELCVGARTLRKWDAAKATPPDSVVKLLSYIVGLDLLEALANESDEALTEALGGSLTIKSVRAFLDDVFDQHDPQHDRLKDPS